MIVTQNDNTTPIMATEYDRKISNTIPYYPEFYNQTVDVVKQCGFKTIKWLDLGGGTGSLEQIAKDHFEEVSFTLVDPSENMIRQAKEKLRNQSVEYLCADSMLIQFTDQFEVVTAIQSHHYMQKEEREKATENVYRALKKGGIYICFENVVPEDEVVKQSELLRWGRYQQRHGKTEEEAKAHNARCGVNYFPLTINEHVQLLKNQGFCKVHVFWYSYMQMGIYGVK